MNQRQQMEQIRKAIQLFGNTLSEEKALEVAAIFDEWKSGISYNAGTFLTYGLNSVGDPQLYKVVQNHISQSDWTPDITASLYSAIGLDDNGCPLWSQPSGAHDAYNKGDIVNFNGALYQSLIDGNVYSPEIYPAAWEVYKK